MDAKKNMPTVKLKLPETGATVVMYKYLTTGQSRELQRSLLEESEVDVETGSLKEMPVKAFLDMQDKSAELLIKKVINKDGEEKEFSKDWLYDLPIKDGNLIYDKVNELTGESNLSNEDRKN